MTAFQQRLFDPVTGPVPRERLAEIAASPYAGAVKEIRKFDPMHARPEGEMMRWKVRFTRTVAEDGHAYVEAASADEAEKIAADLKDRDISDDGFSRVQSEWEVEEVEVSS